MIKDFEGHPVLVRALTNILKDIFCGNFYADKVLERAFKRNRQWGSRDRRFLAETTYNITRWWSFLIFCAGVNFVPEKEEEFLLVWAVYEAWKNNRDVTHFLNEKFSLKLNGTEIQAMAERKPSDPATINSVPTWLYSRLEKQYEGKVKSVLNSLNEPAPVSLRSNGLKTNREKLQALLAAEQIATRLSEFAPDGLILLERQNVFSTKAFKEGLFEVQDEASQKVSILLNPQPGERIADMCAGAGGKTLHLAALMKNKGSLLACDISERKLGELQLRARRAGVSNLRVQLIEGTKTVKRHKDSFDGVLIDAPCSGSGVIRRNPDSKWKFNERELEKLLLIQEEILESYSRLVKPAGRLVYATCSLLEEENSIQVAKFLKKNPQFEKVGEALITRPDLTGEDGFYAQLLIKKKSAPLSGAD